MLLIFSSSETKTCTRSANISRAFLDYLECHLMKKKKLNNDLLT